MNTGSLILLVEDNPHIMEINKLTLESAGFRTLEAESLKRCRELMEFYDIDLIVLDILLPDGNGIEFCREIKLNYPKLPILFLSALSENEDVIRGLTEGGDDYITKPYDLEEFKARISTLIRSTRRIERHLHFEGLCLDLTRGRATIDDRELNLTQREFSLLICLIGEQTGQKQTELYNEMFGRPGDENALRLTVSRLKQKLVGSSVEIITIRKKGYEIKPSKSKN